MIVKGGKREKREISIVCISVNSDSIVFSSACTDAKAAMELHSPHVPKKPIFTQRG